MFTGLVESLGVVRISEPDGQGGRRLVIHESALAPSLIPGESVSVSGVCLTVIDRDENCFTFQVGPETLRKSCLGESAPGDRVNLERSLRVGDRLGGHFVQGHVDGMGVIESRQQAGEWEIVRFRCPDELTLFMVPKGSIAVDGVSLTLVDVGSNFFTVMLIPHTLANTTLGFKVAGDAVNLETDMLARHLAKLTARDSNSDDV